jgi:hypothetical protein
VTRFFKLLASWCAGPAAGRKVQEQQINVLAKTCAA